MFGVFHTGRGAFLRTGTQEPVGEYLTSMAWLFRLVAEEPPGVALPIYCDSGERAGKAINSIVVNNKCKADPACGVFHSYDRRLLEIREI